MADTNKTLFTNIVVRMTGDDASKKMVKSLKDINQSIKETKKSVTDFKSFISGIGSATLFGFGVRELADMADQMTLLTSRISVFVGEGEKTNAVLERLAIIAASTKTSISGTAEVFTRMLTATQRLNIDSEALLELTELLQNSFRLSGATGAEATASTIQFAQALSFGQLRGQELRSVLSQNAILATIFNKAIEGTGKDIYKFAEAGGFTSKFVLTALAKNMDEINSKAGLMKQTFGQTMTLAMNKFTVELDRINRQFDISGNFAKGIDAAIRNIDILAAAMIGMAASAIPSLIAGINALTAAMIRNPLTLLLVAGTSLGAWAYLNMPKVIDLFRAFRLELENFLLPKWGLIWQPVLKGLSLLGDESAGKKLEGFRKHLSDVGFELETLKRKLNGEGEIKGLGWIDDLLDFRQSPLPNLRNDENIPIVSKTKALERAAKNMADPIKSLSQQIADLNTLFYNGGIGVEAYNNKLIDLQLKELQEKLKAGSVDLNKLNEEMRKNALEAYARLLDAGIISIDKFNQKTKEFQIVKLNEDFRKGKADAAEYFNGLAKNMDSSITKVDSWKLGLRAGVETFGKSVGNFTEILAKTTESYMDGFANTFSDALETGKYDFSDFTNSVLRDLSRMLTKLLIVIPLFRSITSAFSFGTGPTTFDYDTSGFSDIASVGGGASVGIASAKTTTLSSQPALSGNLKLASNTSTSPVNVNVINNTSSEVTTKTSTNSDGSTQIDFLIESKVKSAFASGTMDSTMMQTYGISRKGY